MKKTVREFYEKQTGYKNFFEKKKKISFDINDKLLEIIDKMVKLTSNSRTVIINALISSGLSPLSKTMEDTWKNYLKEYEGKLDAGTEKSLKKLISDLNELKKEYELIE